MNANIWVVATHDLATTDGEPVPLGVPFNLHNDVSETTLQLQTTTLAFPQPNDPAKINGPAPRVSTKEFGQRTFGRPRSTANLFPAKVIEVGTGQVTQSVPQV